MSADPFLDGFADPGPEYSATPFWFWNGDLDPAELLRQIGLMDEQGVRAFVIHARRGLTVPYLSEAWFERVGLALEEARRRGMRVWIYDEDNWPSGYAGGAVLAREPGLTPQCLEPERIWLDEGESLDGCPLAAADPRSRGEVLTVLAVPIVRAEPWPRDPLGWHGPQAQSAHHWFDRSAHRLEFGRDTQTLAPLPDAPPASETWEIREFALRLPADPGEGPRADAARALVAAVDAMRWEDGPGGSDPRPVAALFETYEAYRAAPFFRNPGGRWLLMVFRLRTTEWYPAYTSEYYVDVLHPATAPTFLATTHDEYHRRFEEFFGETLVGFFVDEPGLYNNFWDRNPKSIAWTDDFAEAFRASRGYNILPELAWLYESSDDGSDWAEQVRFDFYDFVGELFTERFMRPLADWCTAHGVELMGHLMLEEFMVPMARYAGNPFRALRPLHVPGVDRIDEVYEKVTERIGSSIAHLAGRRRCFSETYALTGWKLAPPMMKEIFDHQALRGVNMLVPHAFYYSIEGFRKDECPPSEFFQNPWWPHSRPFWDYVCRVSYALSQGTPVTSFALYYPIETVFTQITPDDPPGAEAGPTEHWQVPNLWMTPNATDSAFVRTVVALEEFGGAFDLIDHTFLADADVADGRIRIGDLDVATLVIAHATVLAPAAADQVARLIEAGGQVITVGPRPRRLGTDETVPTSLHLPASDTLLARTLFAPYSGDGMDLVVRRRTPTVRNPERSVRYRPGWPASIERELSDRRRVAFTACPVEWDSAVPQLPEAGAGFVEELRPTGDTVTSGPAPLRVLAAPGSRLAAPSGSQPFRTVRPATLTVDIEAATHELATGGPLPTWSELGHPFFSGTATYRATFEDPNVRGLQLAVRETAEIRLNGRHVAYLSAHGDSVVSQVPLDPSWMRDGENTLEIIVASSLAAALQGQESFAGLLSLALVVPERAP